MMQVLKNRSLLVLAGAELVSALGSWITAMALYAIIVFEGEGGVAHTSGLYLAAFGPSLLLSPVAGWLVDRVDRKRLLIAAQALCGVVTAGLIFADSLVLIYALLVLGAAFAVVTSPARQSIVPDVVAPEDLTRANALLQQVGGVIKIVAPLLAGGVLSFMSPQAAIILDVISYLAAAAVLTLLPALPRRQAAQEEHQPGETGLGGLNGLRKMTAVVTREAPLLRVLFPSIFMLVFTLIAFDVTAAVYTRDILRSSAKFMGMAIGLIGLGTGISALLLMLSKEMRNPWRDMVVGMTLMATIPAAMSLGTYLAPLPAQVFLLLACLLGGLGIGLTNVQAATLIQTLAPAGWVGRMGGLFQSMIVGGQLVAMLLTPVLVPHWVSFGLFFGISTACLMLLCIRTAVAVARHGYSPTVPTAETGS